MGFLTLTTPDPAPHQEWKKAWAGQGGYGATTGVEPLGEGRCRVTVRMTYSVPLTLRPLEGSPVVKRLLSSTMRGAMERFKVGLEDEAEGYASIF